MMSIKSDLRITVEVAAIITLVFVLIYALGTLALSTGDAINTEAEIEAVLTIKAAIAIGESEDVVGQIAEINCKIMRYRRQDKIPVYGIFISNRWRNIEPIGL